MVDAPLVQDLVSAVVILLSWVFKPVGSPAKITAQSLDPEPLPLTEFFQFFLSLFPLFYLKL